MIRPCKHTAQTAPTAGRDRSLPTLAALVEHVQQKQKLTLLECRPTCLPGEVNRLVIMDKRHVTLLKAEQL